MIDFTNGSPVVYTAKYVFKKIRALKKRVWTFLQKCISHVQST